MLKKCISQRRKTFFTYDNGKIVEVNDWELSEIEKKKCLEYLIKDEDMFKNSVILNRNKTNSVLGNYCYLCLRIMLKR